MANKMNRVLALLLLSCQLQAQVNINTSPPRLYYMTAAGSSSTQHISIANRSNKPLELVVSLSDWNYDSAGSNHFYEPGKLDISCANWVTFSPGPYLTLAPQEQTVIAVTMSPPAGADLTDIPVRTAMVFVTQLNATPATAADGASVKIALQVGTKLYHSFFEKNNPSVEITNFMDQPAGADSSAAQQRLELVVENNGRGWVEGNIKTELLNQKTGKKTRLEEMPLYSLPGDKRKVDINLPATLEGGLYTATAIISYGKKNEPEIAELEFYLNK